MIERELQSSKSGLSSYHSLSSFEKSLLQLISIIYEPVNRAVLANCLRRAEISGPHGELPTAATIGPTVKRLQDLDLLARNGCCPDSLVEPICRDAVASGSFENLAAAVQAEIPFSQYQSKWPQRCLRAMREYRIGLYRGDMVHLENMHPILDKQCRDTIVRSFPAVRFCNNPFDPEWFATLAPSLQFYLLSQMMNYSLHYLVMPEAVFSYLKSRKTFRAIPPEERLPFHRLLAGMLLWQGKIEEVQELIEETPKSFVASGMEGCLDFLRGNNEKALELFEKDLLLLKKIGSRKKIFFPGIPGLLFILALLKTENAASVNMIRKYIDTVRVQQPGNVLSGAYEMVEQFLTARESGIEHISYDPVTPVSNSVTVLFGIMVEFWLNGYFQPLVEQSTGDKMLLLFLQRARESGFQWLAMEFAELLGRVEQNQTLHTLAADIRKKTGLVSIVDAVILEESWRRRLKALINITSSSDPCQEKLPANSRLVWLIKYDDGRITISAREQKIGADNHWSKGRPVALSRLYSGRKLDFLTDFDRRICKTLKREQNNRNVTYRFELKQTLPAMIGHPLLFLQESPSVSVEFVRGEPELLVEKKNAGLHIKLLNDLSREGVTVIRETATRFKIIEVTGKHIDIARIIGKAGLEVPAEFSSQVMSAVGNLSSYMTVHSAIAVDTKSLNSMNPNAELLKEAEASSQIYIQLTPLGTGFKLAMLVKPFGPRGPFLKPGLGAENVMAEIEGQRFQTKRKLWLEEEKAREIEKACPTLGHYEDNTREWLLQESEACLGVLLELQECMDKVAIEWPEGERISVRRAATLDKLKLRIRGKKTSRGLSWFTVSGSLPLDESLVIDMRRLVELARYHQGKFLPLGNGEFLALTEDFRRRLDDFSYLAESHARDDSAQGSIRIHPLRAMAFAEIFQETGSLEADKSWQQQLELIQEAQLLEPPVPSTLQAELRDYQVEGYQWLARLAHWGGGGCLADDMGLGKTLQALAIILDKAGNGPVMVVAPTSVCMNWIQEANRFAPTLRMHLLGTRKRKTLVQSLKESDVLVTSYTLLQQEAKLLSGIDWQVIVLDEAQAIKNLETKRSRAAMSLNGRFKLLTTGTPIENHLGELWNLFNFILPGLLGSLESFNQRFAIPIERHGDKLARKKLKKFIRPFILRRTKSQVLEELPPRTEITLQVEMKEDELAFYEAIRRQALENLAVENLSAAPKNNKPVPVNISSGKAYTIKILAEIMKLRRACCNPRLIIPDTAIESSKLHLFGKVVGELLENRHKALVFSQFVGHLQIIRSFLDSKKIKYRYLDGATPVRKREQEVKAFQSGRGDLFLISLKAGGLGLNLTAADYVIHMDPWWNPAVEDQASDRAHRIGQVHPVTIYRLITKNTIEEKIVALHREKRDLANSLLSENEISSKISVEELLSLIREQ